MNGLVCVCGHAAAVHHITKGGTRTWCSVFDPHPCPCQRMQLDNDGTLLEEDTVTQ